VAWERLKLMVALIVVAFLALLVLLSRRNANRTTPDRWRARWHWSGSKAIAALALGAVLSVGLVVLVNRFGGGGDTGDVRLKVEYSNLCTDEQGRSVPAPWAGLSGKGAFLGEARGDRTIYQDPNGNEISCPSPRFGG
jgi:hypothetical protein